MTIQTYLANPTDTETMALYFPYLDEYEKYLVYEFSTSNDASMYEYKSSIKDRILLMIRNIAFHFAEAAPHSAQREACRNKLLNLAGLWQVIPIKELTAQMKALHHEIRCDVPDLLHQLLSLTTTTPFLKDFERNVAALVFKKDLRNIQTGDYLSATNEPLTRSIYINTMTTENESRDPFSICFDVIIQTYFLDCFHHQPSEFRHKAAELYARTKSRPVLQALDRQLQLNGTFGERPDWDFFHSLVIANEKRIKAFI